MIAAGGTAGHVVPAIAVADALRDSGAARVSFVGTRERAEATLVPEAGYEIDHLRVSGISRSNPLKAAMALFRATRGVREAKRVLEARGAEVVMGGGGYVAGVTGYAASRMGLPLVLTEADSHLGLSNRRLAKHASAVCLAFPIEGHDGAPYVVTGRPLPRAVVEADPAAARRRFGIGPADRCVSVVGGSLGARSINLAAVEAWAEPPGAGAPGTPWIVHVAGRRDYPELRSRLAAAGDPPRYRLIEYEPTLADVLAAADLVVSRAGGSVMEIAAAGRPALLVPYPHATGDHQTANAAWMVEGGGAVTLADPELTPARLHSEVEALLADPVRLDEMTAASRRLAIPDAAERIAAEVLKARRD